MKLPYSWLAELVEPLPSAETVAEQLIMLGFEVEEILQPGKEIQDVIVAELLERNPHPNADKLSLCKVYDGETEHEIVCGADNMQAGDRVALARIGTVLPGDFKIEKRKIRGVQSSGMMCSLRELRLGEDHAGIMILPNTYTIGNRLVDEMGFNDTIFDISITPNRPDALNAVGIARELAAKNGSALRVPPHPEPEPDVSPDFSPTIGIESDDLCYRYAGLVIQDFEMKPSPEWLKKRLEACGVRSINVIVDATNYVLLEMGQPLHAFDYDRLNGHRIVVRKAKPGESITTLDGEKRSLPEETPVIADADRPVAVAGVMGGLDSEVNESTRTLLLESAYFFPSSIHRTAKQLKLSTEASYRFERGVDFEGVVPAAWRCADLIAKLAGGKIVGKMTLTDTPHTERITALQGHTQSLNYAYCHRILGKTFTPDEMESLLAPLGFEVLEKGEDQLTVRVPSYRNDVQYPADLAEEVARSYGYDRFESAVPLLPARPPERQEISHHFMNRLRDHLTASGMDECVTYTFSDSETLRSFSPDVDALQHPMVNIENPISPRETTLRASVVPSLLLAAQRNVSYTNPDFSLFELGRAYFPQEGTLAREVNRVAGVVVGHPQRSWRDRRTEQDFFDIKGLVEGILQLGGIQRYRQAPAPDWMHPKRGCAIQLGKEVIGCYGELHPDIAERFDLPGRIGVFEIDIQPLYDRAEKHTPQPKPLSNYPAVKRDFAFMVPENVSTRQIEECILQNAKSILEEIVIFDYYQGKQIEKGMVSTAFRLVFRSAEGTLTEETVDETCQSLLDTLKQKLNVERRS